jgi:hypothetical protein
MYVQQHSLREVHTLRQPCIDKMIVPLTGIARSHNASHSTIGRL